MNKIKKGNETSGSIKFWENGGFSRRTPLHWVSYDILITLFVRQNYTAFSDRLINEQRIGKNVDWSGRGLICVSTLGSGRRDWGEQQNPGARTEFEPWTTRIRSKSVSHSDAIFKFEILTAEARCQFLRVAFLVGLLLDPEDRGDILLRNIDPISPDYISLYPKKTGCRVR
jgi:hypothetical protein